MKPINNNKNKLDSKIIFIFYLYTRRGLSNWLIVDRKGVGAGEWVAFFIFGISFCLIIVLIYTCKI